MSDDHTPEGRTAHECFELARIALDQAEQVLNRATTTLECEKATASAAISRGWSALGDALANEPHDPGPTEHAIGASAVHQAMNTHRFDAFRDTCPACRMTREEAAMAAGRGQICRPGPHWGGPIPIKLSADLDPKLNPLVRTPPRLYTEHQHSPDCAHQWIRPGEPCAECGQGQIRNQERCPTPCPEPGDWWVHLPGEQRRRA